VAMKESMQASFLSITCNGAQNKGIMWTKEILSYVVYDSKITAHHIYAALRGPIRRVTSHLDSLTKCMFQQILLNLQGSSCHILNANFTTLSFNSSL
jgi:hypothetical protein